MDGPLTGDAPAALSSSTTKISRQTGLGQRIG
jgi:hypothetical protein